MCDCGGAARVVHVNIADENHSYMDSGDEKLVRGPACVHLVQHERSGDMNEIPTKSSRLPWSAPHVGMCGSNIKDGDINRISGSEKGLHSCNQANL